MSKLEVSIQEYGTHKKKFNNTVIAHPVWWSIYALLYALYLQSIILQLFAKIDFYFKRTHTSAIVVLHRRFRRISPILSALTLQNIRDLHHATITVAFVDGRRHDMQTTFKIGVKRLNCYCFEFLFSPKLYAYHFLNIMSSPRWSSPHNIITS